MGRTVTRARPPGLPHLLARFVVGLFIAAASMATVVAPVVNAEDVTRLERPVTDSAGVLGDRTGEVERSVDATRDAHGVQVWVLFVRTTGGRSTSEFAAETAAASSLGAGDALLLVAMDDRTYELWVSNGLEEVTDAELDTILAETLEPRLADGDPAGAAIATVEAVGVAAEGGEPTIVPGPTATTTPGGGGTNTGGGGFGIETIVGIALVAAGGGYLVYRRWRASRQPVASQGPAAEPGRLTGPALIQRANAMLIATDERIRDAQQEVDFAEAQYGPEEVESLRGAVSAAQGELGTAFTIRQRLDDDEPEDEATRESMLREIVDRTTRAQATLDAETDRIRQLRDLERDAPATLVELPGRIELVEDRLPAARERLAHLTRYARPAWQSVEGNVEEADKGLDGARTAVTIASAAMSRDDRGDVAIATREALEGVTGAASLLDAIDRLAETIAEAERRIPSELAEADRDLQEARGALTDAGVVDDVLTTRVREGERALDEAHRASRADPADPLETLRLVTEAHRQADALLVAARDAVTAWARLEAAAQSSVRTAAAEVDRASDFIASRRRGVGETARTRLAEAQRHLEMASAVVATEPSQAVELGRRAERLAQEAYRLAASDFSDWDQGGPGWGQRGGSGDQTAEILGGIIGGILGGVVRSGTGGGWGGSPWGGPRRGGGGFGGLGGDGGLGGLGGGWGGGGGFGSGGFGGGGGGGRSRGGRW
jgi:hypothetical protein